METPSTEDLGTTGPWSPSHQWGPGCSFSFSDSSDATFSGGPNAPWPRSGHSTISWDYVARKSKLERSQGFCEVLCARGIGGISTCIFGVIKDKKGQNRS